MAKKVAVLVRDRQGEPLRVGVGITVMDDEIDIYVLDRKIEDNDENEMNLEMIGEMEMKLYTNNKDNEDMEYISTEDLAKKLLEYDNVIAY